MNKFMSSITEARPPNATYSIKFKPESQITQSIQHPSQEAQDAIIEPTKKRFLVLLLYIILQTIKAYQWICLASITNVMSNFYRVDNMAINWSAILFMFTFLFLALPVSCIMDIIGIRISIIIGTLGVTLGVIIKCFSCHRDGYTISMIGHLMIGLTEPFYYSSYTQIASRWFPDNQVSMAVSLGVIGDQLGIALGFIVPGLMVGDDPFDIDAVQSGLYNMMLGMAIISTLNTVLIFIFFDEQPKNPPGKARFNQIREHISRQQSEERISFGRQFARFVYDYIESFKDKNLWILLVGFGLNVGTNYSLHTVLNQMLLSPLYRVTESMDDSKLLNETTSLSDHSELSLKPFAEPMTDYQVVGDAGLLLVVSGFFGLMTFGYLLDTFHRYKATIVSSYLLTTIFMFVFTACLYFRDKLLLLILSLPLGFFIASYTCCGFEYGVELTYPRAELLSTQMLNVSAQLFGIPISFLSSYLVDKYGSLAGGIFFTSVLSVGLAITLLQRGELKRQKTVESTDHNSDLRGS